MNIKSASALLISIIVIIGFIILFPNNSVDLKIITLGLEKDGLLYTFFYYVTFLGSRIIFIPFVIIGSIYLYLKFKKIQPSIVFISGTLLSYLLNELIKRIVQRTRPSIIEGIYGIGYSFPSGHAMISTVCYGLFVYYLIKIIKDKKPRQLLIILTTILLLIIGYSRLVLKVHYFTDVLGGYLIGMLFISSYLKITNDFFKRRSLK